MVHSARLATAGSGVPPEAEKASIVIWNHSIKFVYQEESDSGSFRSLGKRVCASTRGFESHLLRTE